MRSMGMYSSVMIFGLENSRKNRAQLFLFYDRDVCVPGQ